MASPILQKNEKGLSLLEIVVAVAIIAIFAVVGTISFQHLTDNARQTAVQQAADDVFTLAMATKELPNGANTIGTLDEIAVQHNESSSDIVVDILEESPDITVTASGWDGRYTAIRSTIPDHDGIIRTPDDEGEPVEDINQYADGVFSFTTPEENSQLALYGLSDNATIDHDSFEEPQNLTEGVTTLEAPGTYTINGGFEKIGIPHDRLQMVADYLNAYNETGDLDAAAEMLGAPYQENVEATYAIANTPFINGAEIHEWKDTGTTSAMYAFSGSNMRNMPAIPTTIEYMNGMFAGAQSIVFDITDWDTSNVRDMSYLFQEVETFNQDIGGWDTSSVEMLVYTFNEARAFNQDISKWDVSNVEAFSGTFLRADSFNQPLNTWDVSSAIFLEQMFNYAYSFNQPLDKWDTSNTTTTQSMFKNATSFNQDISDWDTSKVSNMSYMFENATSFDQDISDWDVSNVEEMQLMFDGATVFNNGGEPLDWENTSKLRDVYSMFRDAKNFDQDLSSWNTSNVERMSYMFYYAEKFNNGGKPLNWDTSNVNDMSRMFRNAKSFNQDISQWDVSNVTDMDAMFYHAKSFNQDLSGWDVSNMSQRPASFNNFSHPEFSNNRDKQPQW